MSNTQSQRTRTGVTFEATQPIQLTEQAVAVLVEILRLLLATTDGQDDDHEY